VINWGSMQATGGSAVDLGDGNDSFIGHAGSGVSGVIDGGAGDDVLRTADADDTLHGGDGNDLLNGGAGADVMAGDAGDDIYVVDNAGDQVTELADAGTDRVNASIDYTLGANVENLVLTGSAVAGTGNELNNVITGNAGANALLGGGGNDAFRGGAGNDLLVGGAGNDVMIGGDGADVFAFRPGFGADKVADFGASDFLDLRGLGFASAEDAITAFARAGANVVLNLGGGDQLTLQHVQKADLDAGHIIVSDTDLAVVPANVAALMNHYLV
jgi:Ca2+-binding RTX toxin-like protein